MQEGHGGVEEAGQEEGKGQGEGQEEGQGRRCCREGYVVRTRGLDLEEYGMI